MKCLSVRLCGWNQSTDTTTSSGDGCGWCDHSSDGLQHDRLRPTSGLQPAIRSDASSGLQLGAVRLRSRLDTGQSRYSSQCTLCGVVCCHYILICRKHKLTTLCMGLNAYKLEKLVYVHIQENLQPGTLQAYPLTNNMEGTHTFSSVPMDFKTMVIIYTYCLLMIFGGKTVSFKSIFWCCSWGSNLSPPACEAEARAVIQQDDISILYWILLYTLLEIEVPEDYSSIHTYFMEELCNVFIETAIQVFYSNIVFFRFNKQKRPPVLYLREELETKY